MFFRSFFYIFILIYLNDCFITILYWIVIDHYYCFGFSLLSVLYFLYVVWNIGFPSVIITVFFHFLEDDIQSYDSEDRLRNHRNNRATPTPPDHHRSSGDSPLHGRHRNRSNAGSVDETHHPGGIGGLMPRPRRGDERRKSSPAETSILEAYPSGLPLHKSRPQTLPVPVRTSDF